MFGDEWGTIRRSEWGTCAPDTAAGFLGIPKHLVGSSSMANSMSDFLGLRITLELECLDLGTAIMAASILGFVPTSVGFGLKDSGRSGECAPRENESLLIEGCSGSDLDIDV